MSKPEGLVPLIWVVSRELINQTLVPLFQVKGREFFIYLAMLNVNVDIY